jgi:hypothetical protein
MLGRHPHGRGHILDMHRVGAQIFVPQPLHLALLALEDAGQTQRCSEKIMCVRTVDVGQAQHAQIQAVHLGQIFLGLELPFGQAQPWFELCGLGIGRRRGFVDHAGGQLDKDADLAARGLGTDGGGEGVRAGAVDLVVLRVSRFAAAVEDVVEFPAVGAVEYAGHVF